MKMRKGGLIGKLSRIYRKKVEAIIIAQDAGAPKHHIKCA